MATGEAQQQDERRETDAESGSSAEPAVQQRGRLTRLKINRFRNVVPGTELHFDHGINVLLGRNGTGKTTLLELIAAVVSGDLRAYERDEFDIELDMRFGRLSWMVSVRSSPANAKPPTRMAKPSWHYRVRVADSDKEIFARSAESSLATGEQPTPFDAQFYAGVGMVSPDAVGQEYQDRMLESFAVQLRISTTCLRLDEGLDVFRCITGYKPLPRLGAPLTLYVPSELDPSNAGDPVRFIEVLGNTWYVPLSILSAALHQITQLQGRMEIDFDAERLEFISSALDLLRAKDLRLRMRLIHGKEGGDAVDGSGYSAFGMPAFWITTHQGSTFTHDRLSYGEKRLLAFMYHAAANPDILVADELVNGLHHEWIQACLDAIQGQAFLTSQNPLLLDYLPFSSAEEVQRRFVLCSSDDEGNWTWKNMDPDDADAFFGR